MCSEVHNIGFSLRFRRRGVLVQADKMLQSQMATEGGKMAWRWIQWLGNGEPGRGWVHRFQSITLNAKSQKEANEICKAWFVKRPNFHSLSTLLNKIFPNLNWPDPPPITCYLETRLISTILPPSLAFASLSSLNCPYQTSPLSPQILLLMITSGAKYPKYFKLCKTTERHPTLTLKLTFKKNSEICSSLLPCITLTHH